MQALYDDWKWSACMYPACSWAFAEARPQPHIRFSGSSIIALDDYSASREISGPSFGIMVQPSEQRKVEHIPSWGHQRWLAILLTRETFVDMFESTLSDLPQFLTAFSAGKADQPFIASAQLTKTLSQTAIAMFSSQLRGSTRRMFFEAKTLELLSIVSEQLTQQFVPGKRLTLTTRDSDKIREVFRLLEDDPSTLPNMSVLARQLGLNRDKLIKGFKQIHGQTITEASLALRMHRARELLHSGESVTRVADLAGYAYIGNFSAAYRTFFGTSPTHEHRKHTHQSARGPIV
ncbi:helix-turn-helix domain-containing protein [Paraburkholderia aspalathi]|uniref:helix-turn-helix domain-containing protein n=1 Tax=Paraburkholderia aspalathi TaxID=1324617 RepID=UPI0038BC15FA